MTKGPVLVRQLPQCSGSSHRNSFLSEIQTLAEKTYRPRLVLDLLGSPRIEPDAIDLLLECVEQVERADGRVSVAVDCPETAVILELTRLNTVLDMFSSVSDAVGGEMLHNLQHHGDPQQFAA